MSCSMLAYKTSYASCSVHIVPIIFIYAHCSMQFSNASLAMYLILGILFYSSNFIHPYIYMHNVFHTLFCASPSVHIVICISFFASHYLHLFLFVYLISFPNAIKHFILYTSIIWTSFQHAISDISCIGPVSLFLGNQLCFQFIKVAPQHKYCGFCSITVCL